MRQIDLVIDVTHAVDLDEQAHVAATIALPDRAALTKLIARGERPVLCFAKPSSAYALGYYTCGLPGPGAEAGSQAAWHAARGWIVAALDTLGCGDSSHHDPAALDFATIGAAAAAAEREIALRLANGVLTDGFPAVHQPLLLGLGHAAGGSLLIWQQAHHRSYDGIAVLGFSAVHSHPPTPPGGEPVGVAWYARDAAPEGHGGAVSEPLNGPELDALLRRGGASSSAWHALAWGFHHDDVPEDIVEQNLLHYEAIALGMPTPPLNARAPAPWQSATTPQRVARSTLTPGVVASEAAAIAVPVLSAIGERDLVRDPPGEARAFLSAPSVDLFVCPRLGHMHNFGGTRALFWDRIHRFGEWCAALKAAR